MPFHIPLADDDDLVALILYRVLESHGYRVSTAGHGPQALEAAVDDSSNLLVTDMRMPVMAGHELIDLIRLSRPDLPVVLMTGNRENVPTVQPGRFLVLLKPFAVQNLVEGAELSAAPRLRTVDRSLCGQKSSDVVS